MTHAQATAIIKQNTDSYNAIAGSFSASRNNLWKELLCFKEEMHISHGVKVLDAGCGNGRLLDLFDGRKVSYYGIDSSGKLLERARVRAKERKMNAEFEEADVCALPYPDNYFDYVFCVAVLHHIPIHDLRLKAMQEFARVLAPSGKLFMTNWNLWRLTAKGKSVWKYMFSQKRRGALKRYGLRDVCTLFGAENKPLYYYAFCLGDLHDLAKEAGFIVQKACYIKHGESSHWWNAQNSMLVARRYA